MKRFMAMLSRNKHKDPPPTNLLDLAGQLCRDFQSSFPNLEKLVGAVMRCKQKMHFLTNIHVVRACVFVHIRNGQHDTACRLLECCRAEEKEELVQLWHEIHYHRIMEKHHRDFLTPLQKFRCRKRNPPPISLCPEGLKNRNYSNEVRQQLYKFAAEVTTNPNKKQRVKALDFKVCSCGAQLFRYPSYVMQDELEGLAQDMNLQPAQVYNWFANYRRRQKSRICREEKLNYLCPEGTLMHHAKDQQNRGSYTPQTAGGSYVGIGSEQTEINLMPCDPGWEQAATDMDKSPEGMYLKMLESSFIQSSALCEPRTSKALMTHITEQPVAFFSEAVLEPGTCFNSAVFQPREAASSIDAGPQLDNFVVCSCGSLIFPGERLAMWQAPSSTTGVSGSMWTPNVEAGVRAPLSRVPQGGFIEASSGRIIRQSDLEVESFTLREGQLGTLEAILPHSSHQTVAGKPQCPPVSAPCMEESQAMGQGQVLEDPVGDPLADDTFWAAQLLFEFSAGGQM